MSRRVEQRRGLAFGCDELCRSVYDWALVEICPISKARRDFALRLSRFSRSRPRQEQPRENSTRAFPITIVSHFLCAQKPPRPVRRLQEILAVTPSESARARARAKAPQHASALALIPCMQAAQAPEPPERNTADFDVLPAFVDVTGGHLQRYCPWWSHFDPSNARLDTALCSSPRKGLRGSFPNLAAPAWPQGTTRRPLQGQQVLLLVLGTLHCLSGHSKLYSLL